MAQQTDKYSNPAFDNRIYTLPKLQTTAPGTGVSTNDLQRGYIIQDAGYNAPGVVYSARFLYNPSTVTVTHSSDPTSSGAITPQQFRNPLDTSKPNLPLQTTVAFNLLFDRTYEMWDAGAPNPNPYDRTASPSQVGCLVDVAALYRVVGILQPTVSQPPTMPKGVLSKSGAANFGKGPYITSILNQGSIGPLPMLAVTAYFGGPNSLSYHGYVNNLTVQWTHFSQLMVPFRCTVNVSMLLITDTKWDNALS